ncbi:unnamed protein product [Durusdinium trenchii]|uniref:Protein kinase domain-containing protein n=1 Tax=Durusdinium trenchii TaxID=1381693 RepID=A0ABP0PKJ4_9DINO
MTSGGTGCDEITEGDCRYLAKEVLRGDLRDLTKADIFSLGLVLYELATNPQQLPSNGPEWQMLRERLEVQHLRQLSHPVQLLLQEMVKPQKEARPSCEAPGDTGVPGCWHRGSDFAAKSRTTDNPGMAILHVTEFTRMPVNENDSYLRHAAVVIVGGARSLGWNMVCDPEQHVCCSESYGPNFLLEPCQALLKPVYTEYMVPVYKPPKSHGCLELADDYISQVYEPKVGFQYSAVIRARPDDIFLRDVPPLPSYNLSRFTVAAGGIADHWHVVHRGCRMAPPECIHCKDAVNDTSCGSYGVYDLDTRVHPVLAREEPSSYFLKKRIRLPSRPRGKSSSAGYLHLECQRWRDRLAKNAPVAYEQLRGLNLCEQEEQNFLFARPAA